MDDITLSPELKRINDYWGTVKAMEEDFYRNDDSNLYYVCMDCNNDLLKNRNYDGLVALIAKTIALNYDGVIPKKNLFDIYQELTDKSKPTIYKRIDNTIEAIGWKVEKSGIGDLINTDINQYKDENGNVKLKGYVKLTPLEVEQLMKTKNGIAIKVYLRIRQQNSVCELYPDSLGVRKMTITGNNGMAQALGYATTNADTINKAIDLLEENYLIATTGNQYNPNNMGKYILINAIMGDSMRRWVTYNLGVYNSNTIFNKIVKPRVLIETMYEDETFDMAGAY